MNAYLITHGNGEKDWIAAKTNVEAICFYMNALDLKTRDMEGATIEEVPKDKWDSNYFSRGSLSYNITSYIEGLKNDKPDFIATTQE
jgi:hypothetical protein